MRPVLGLAPVIGVVFVREPLVNQKASLDAWFSYGWTPPRNLTVFESTSFGARFCRYC